MWYRVLAVNLLGVAAGLGLASSALAQSVPGGAITSVPGGPVTSPPVLAPNVLIPPTGVDINALPEARFRVPPGSDDRFRVPPDEIRSQQRSFLRQFPVFFLRDHLGRTFVFFHPPPPVTVPTFGVRTNHVWPPHPKTVPSQGLATGHLWPPPPITVPSQ